MGFTGPEKMNILTQLNVQFDSKNNVKIDEKGMTVGIDKVFVTGALFIVRAIKAGKEIMKK